MIGPKTGEAYTGSPAVAAGHTAIASLGGDDVIAACTLMMKVDADVARHSFLSCSNRAIRRLGCDGGTA
jgi:hypothetical protein